MLDALSYALFGKAHRNINIPQLTNTVNKKDCLVEVVFNVGASTFKVVRGMKPNIFEIWKNDSLLNQEASNREYQKVLEQNIIKLNHKSFHQIVVLGSSSFIPFMQLPAQHRRDIIEDLLDINVFSKMNILMKEKNSLLKDILKDLDYKLNINDNAVKTQTKYIDNMSAMNDEEIKDKENLIEQTNEEISNLQSQNSEHSSFLEKNQIVVEEKLDKTHNKRTQLLQYKSEFSGKAKDVVKSAKFYENNDTCPTCSQDILKEVRQEKLTSAKKKAKELSLAMAQADEAGSGLEEDIKKLNDQMSRIRTIQSNINANNQEIRSLQNNIKTLMDSIKRLRSRDGDLSKAKSELNELIEAREELRSDRFTNNEQYSYNTVIAEMLKDTGIKTKVVKQYLPVINKFINQYLQVLDFFVYFHLDEAFNETLRSRHRDNFSYSSFSEGEKQRIDLALLFTWRMIAKMKNSVSTNLLILDETFDSSLDHDGVDNLMKILYTLDKDSNVFVISHKGEILEGKFKRKLEFFKDKNFSKMTK